MSYYSYMLTDSAVLKTTAGTDLNGEPKIIAEETISCKIEFKNSLAINSQGQELTSAGRLFTESVVKVDDIITINKTDYKVINVNPYYPIDSSVLVINEVYFA
ncbi:MAG: hypothetical protein KHX03_06300 [Clostridium sp.]|nr:hypothetical protein [Clostridium sp.]